MRGEELLFRFAVVVVLVMGVLLLCLSGWVCAGLAVIVGAVWGGCSNCCVVVWLFLRVWCRCLVSGSRLYWWSVFEA